MTSFKTQFDNFTVETLILGAIAENCYIVKPKGSNDCIIVDPGFPMDPHAHDNSILSAIRRSNLQPAAILLTHGHFDHIGGVNELKSTYPGLKVYVGDRDAYKLTNPIANLSAFHDVPIITQDPDVLLKDGESFKVAELNVKASEIPGHSIGHVVYQFDAGNNVSVVFCGDVVFTGSIGRTDFPDGNINDLLNGIRNKLLVLPDETILFPGHGSATTVGIERKTNPFFSKSF